MMRAVFCLVAVLVLTCGLGVPAVAGDNCDSCVKAKEADGFCKHCKVGFVQGKPVKCQACFEAAHTDGRCDHCKLDWWHGQAFKCASCLEGAKSDGACAHCKVFFAKGKAMKCEGCAKAAREDGACDHCKLFFAQGQPYKCEGYAKAAREEREVVALRDGECEIVLSGVRRNDPSGASVGRPAGEITGLEAEVDRIGVSEASGEDRGESEFDARFHWECKRLVVRDQSLVMLGKAESQRVIQEPKILMIVL